jgi:hypothetical protein
LVLEVSLKRGALAALLVAGSALLACDAAEKKPASRNYQLQLGLGPAVAYNLEEPFINIAQARGASWSFQTEAKEKLDGGDAVQAGYLDPETYMPTPKARSAKYAAVAVFFPGADSFRNYYADDYVLDWKGEARGFMQRWEQTTRPRRSDNAVIYPLKPAQVTESSLRFSSIGEGFRDVRFYREKNRALLDQGKVWNPAFIDYIRRYDIVRTMDVQATNNSPVRRFDQIARVNEPWGQSASLAWPESPFYGAPYEILFDLGVEADVSIWLTIPPQIGSPTSASDPSLRQEGKAGRIAYKKVMAAAAANAKKTLESPEWEVFARAFADRYLASGYPQSRPLYIEMANEVWNFAPPFLVSSNYAIGIAKGVNPQWKIGHGYGVLSARFMAALEKEFAKRKVKPNVIYVIASHTADPGRTRQALEGVAGELKALGEDPAKYLPKTGVAVTNYYGNFNSISKALFGTQVPSEYAPMWIKAIRENPDEFADRVSALLVDGPANVKLTSAWIVAHWKMHQTVAEKAGSRFIGAYEGGSHLVPPKELASSKAFLDWWMNYHWGEAGAGVARAVNRDLIEAFPGAIISNYKSIGRPGPANPWIDGHPAAPTPMLRMWDEFGRPGHGG